MPLDRTSAMKAIHILGSKKGFDHDEIRSIACSLFNIAPDKISLKELKDDQLIALLQTLRGSTKGQPVQIKYQATARQLYKINELVNLLGWDNQPNRLSGFLVRQCKKDRLGELTKHDAIKVIDGLKTMYEREKTNN